MTETTPERNSQIAAQENRTETEAKPVLSKEAVVFLKTLQEVKNARKTLESGKDNEGNPLSSKDRVQLLRIENTGNNQLRLELAKQKNNTVLKELKDYLGVDIARGKETSSPKQSPKGERGNVISLSERRKAQEKKNVKKDVKNVWADLQDLQWPRAAESVRDLVEGKLAVAEISVGEALKTGDFKTAQDRLQQLEDGIVHSKEMEALADDDFDRAVDFVRRRVIEPMKKIVDGQSEQNKTKGEVFTLKKTAAYRELYPRFQSLVRSNNWDGAQRSIKTIENTLHTEFDEGSISKEAFDQLLKELQDELASAQETYKKKAG